MLPEFSKYEVKNSWQRAYLDSFIEKGWPSSKNEEWKFTSLSGLFEKPFLLASKPKGDTRVNNGIIGEEVHRIVFRNGIFDTRLSDDRSSYVIVTNLFDDDGKYFSNYTNGFKYHSFTIQDYLEKSKDDDYYNIPFRCDNMTIIRIT